MKTIVNKSDFKITAQLKPVNDNNTILNPLEFEWIISYYVNQYRKFTASHTFVEGASVLSEGVSVSDGIITIRINGFDFQYKGVLKRDMMISFPDPSFSDSTKEIYVRESMTDVNIV